MAGPESHIHAALMARVESLSLSPEVPVAYPGVPFGDTDGDYIRVTHIRNQPVRWGVSGTSAMDRMGMLQLDLFTVISDGSWQVKPDQIAEDIAAHFPRDLAMTSGGCVAKVFKAWIGQSAPDPDGTHWQTPVIVDYRASG